MQEKLIVSVQSISLTTLNGFKKKKNVLENKLSVRLIFVMPYSEADSKNAGKRGRKNLL